MIRTAWFVLLIVVVCGCGKQTSYVPDVPVSYNTLLSDPALVNLNSSSKGVIINGYGVSGLVLYKSINRGIVAYDRCSTVNPEARCAVNLDDAFTVTDPCSGAKFLLEDGSPAKAPAVIALKEYSVLISGNTIRVAN